jgi:DNA polymerase-3 subunit gamma/tau
MAGDSSAALAVISHMSEHAPDFEGSLDELISLIHRVAIAQAVPDAIDNNWGDAERVGQIAKAITQEDAQLFYQVAINGKRDIGLAADPRSGFEMLVLRMIAFRPAAVLDESLTPDDLQPGALPLVNTVAGEVDPPLKKPLDAPAGTAPELPPAQPIAEQAPAPVLLELSALTPDNWVDTLEKLGLVGIVYNIAANCELRSRDDNSLEFVLDRNSSNLFNEGHAGKMRMALENYFGITLSVSVVPDELSGETPAMIKTRRTEQRQREAVIALEGDPLLQQLIERFDGELDRTSIVPLEP